MANRVYSNAFFHYTHNFEFVKNILEDGFKVFFCREEVYSSEKRVMHIGIPVVCFCDLPLSHIAQNNYGQMGIGMSRKWGIAKMLVPVFYYPNNAECFSTKTILQASKAFLKKRPAAEYRALGHSKPLYKIQPDKGQSKNNYIEREWRRVFYSAGVFKWKTEAEYDAYRGDKSTPKTPVGNPITFNVDDVDFIIVPENKKTELLDFIMRRLSTIGGAPGVASMSDREVLASKIVTVEQLARNV